MALAVVQYVVHASMTEADALLSVHESARCVYGELLRQVCKSS